MRRRRPGGDISNINVGPNGIGWEGKDWVNVLQNEECWRLYSVCRHFDVTMNFGTYVKSRIEPF